jgi:monoamine oxidase
VITRRTFLERIGHTGGSVAVHGAMRSLGLAATPAAPWRPPRERAPAGTKVVILGAGLAGLAAAYELQKLGYHCEVLDARQRTGGRCVTIRRGFVSEEKGVPPQKAEFDPDLYFNAGPMRIPHHHTPTLDYCRELGVPIEAFCAFNEAAYVHDATAPEGARRLRVRELRADWRGYTSEMLAKAVTSDALDRPMTKDDRDRIVEWLRQEGGLSAEIKYAGSARRGYASVPGMGTSPGVMGSPVAFDALLKTGFGRYLSTEFAMQSPMFQIVGGTDQLQKALASKVLHITLGAEVTAIEQPAGGVRIKYTASNGAAREITADYTISTIALPILRGIQVDASDDVKEAIANINYASAAKIGLQFARRFWEQDDQIFGGMTRTTLDITQIVYPSTGYLSKKGIVIGYYINGPGAAKVGELAPAERLKKALDEGGQIHPQYASAFEHAFSIAWQKVAYSQGGWAQFNEAQRKKEYLALLRPDRQLYFAGDYTTYISGWMAGAFQSARSVVSAIHERAQRERMTTAAARWRGGVRR